MANQETIRTPKFRAAWPDVFKPRSFQGGDEKYGCSMIFEKDTDLSQMEALADSVLKAKFGPSAELGKGYRSPFIEGNTQKSEECHGKILVRTRTKFAPNVVDRNRRKIESEDGFYGGCYALASIHAYAYDTAGNRGVAFGLDNVQFHSHGDPISRGLSVEESFEDLDEAEGSAAGEVSEDMA